MAKPTLRLMSGDAIEKVKELSTQSIDCIFCSPDPPFSSRIGMAAVDTMLEYIQYLVNFFHQASRVLKDKGTVFVQMGDQHDNDGSLRMTPYIFALSMKSDGWLLRSDLIWNRPDEIIQEDLNRFIRDCEHMFMFTKTPAHFFNMVQQSGLIRARYIEPRQGEWLSGFPEELIRVCLQSGCPPGGVVLDPFCGTGTTGAIALIHGMSFIGIELEEWKNTKTLKRLKGLY